MQMPVAVGVILAIMFLVTFSEWFFHLIKGWKEIVLDDVFFWYRIGGVTILSLGIMSGAFVVAAIASECPKMEGETIAEDSLVSGFYCEKYTALKSSADKLFQGNESALDPALEEKP